MTILTKSSASIAAMANTAGNVSAGATIGGGGILVIMGQNAPAIGAICVIIGLAATMVFKTIGYMELRRHNKAMETKDEKSN